MDAEEKTISQSNQIDKPGIHNFFHREKSFANSPLEPKPALARAFAQGDPREAPCQR